MLTGSKNYDGKKISIPISDDAELDLLEHWTMQAVSSFMSAFVTTTATKLPKNERHLFTTCSKQANAVNKHAKCVMRAIEASKKFKDSINDYENEVIPSAVTTAPDTAFITETYSSTPHTIGPVKLRKLEMLREKYRRLYQKSKLERFNAKKYGKIFMRDLRDHTKSEFSKQNWRRTKRALLPFMENIQQQEMSDEKPKVVKQDNYNLISANENHSSFGILMKYFTRTLRRMKHKTENKSWKTDVLRIRQLEKDLRNKEAKEEGKGNHLYDLYGPSPKRQRSRKTNDWSDEIMSHLPPSFKQRFPDFMNVAKQKDPLGTPLLVRKAVKLAMSITGQNTTDFDKKNVKLISPRFFSIVPEQNTDDIHLFSPSLFSLHDDGKEAEKQFSISNLLKSTQLIQSQDQDEIVNLIAEATGVADVVEDVHKVKSLKNETDLKEGRGIDGQPMYFTKENATEIYGKIGKEKIETFERLHASLTKAQLKEMNSTGFSMLTPQQLEMFYGEDSPYASNETLKKLSNLTNDDKLYELIEHDIALLKDSPSVSLHLKKQKRHKRQIALSPVLLTPLVLMPATLSQLVVLSPVVLSPVILSPCVLGPFVLSPWVFVPVILSPRVLAPIILSPLIFSPVILSPLALHPFILSPGIFNPFILSPSVLTPFILSPQVATPFILSPLCLNPLILNPMVMSPLILSPFVLSPLILSPQHIFALVLSPHALSPLIESKLTESAVVASPSFLS